MSGLALGQNSRRISIQRGKNDWEYIVRHYYLRL